MKILTIILMVGLAYSFPVKAGDESEPSFRTYYDRINSRLQISPTDNKNLDVEYQTYSNWVVGAAFQLGLLSVGVERGIPTAGDARKQRTDVSGVHAMIDLKQWNIEAYWFGFNGFNVTDPGIDLDDNSGEPLTKRSDIRAYFLGANASFVKTPEDVWLAGQFESLPVAGFGWSAVGHVRAAAASFNSREGLIPVSARETFVGDRDIKGLDCSMLGGGPGLAGSFVGGNFRVGVAMALTLGWGFVNARNGTADGLQSSVNLNSRLGTAYQMGDFEVGVFGVFDFDPGSTEFLSYQIDREVIQTYLRVQL